MRAHAWCCQMKISNTVLSATSIVVAYALGLVKHHPTQNFNDYGLLQVENLFWSLFEPTSGVSTIVFIILFESVDTSIIHFVLDPKNSANYSIESLWHWIVCREYIASKHGLIRYRMKCVEINKFQNAQGIKSMNHRTHFAVSIHVGR